MPPQSRLKKKIKTPIAGTLTHTANKAEAK